MEIHEMGELFREVQMKNILGDGKTFPDCVPNRSLTEINTEYHLVKNDSLFDLKSFIEINFKLPKEFALDYKSDLSKPLEENITSLWDVLTRNPDENGGSLIPLPKPYIVPGGRFREIYYWDSYFTMLGLKVSGRTDMIQHMVDNFAFLINTHGYIPNGNRTYFLGRSQPPFFSLMVSLLGDEAIIKYLPELEKEYQFWMKGENILGTTVKDIHRVVLLQDGSILNRYWDENNSPRPEAYKEDVELAHTTSQQPEDLYRNLRAAAESGWDFSSRWFKDETDFATIHTTEIIPIDLNCLLLNLEKTLELGFKQSGDFTKSIEFGKKAHQRQIAIIKYCWNEEKKFFFDFDFIAYKQKELPTLAGIFPLFFNIATKNQAEKVADVLLEKFLKPGGMTTTLSLSGQQWDAPNGWAPLQWVTFIGLLNYGFNELAEKLKNNWLNANKEVFYNSGKMTEKYNVWSNSVVAQGGEYPNQDGFGWTNGVYLSMINSGT